MPLFPGKDTTLDDVHVLGTWNFTLQSDTPLYWIRSGVLDRYHMRFQVHTSCPSTCGIIIHGEADGAGTDGVSFWSERRRAKEGSDAKDTRRYILAGNGLDSRSIVTRTFPDDGGNFHEEVEVLVQGYTGAVFLQGRKITLKFRMKQGRGCVAFYNSSSVRGGQDDVTFSDVRITALHRGQLEMSGKLGQRERAVMALDERPASDEPAEDQNTIDPRSEGVSSVVAADVVLAGAAPLDASTKPGGDNTCSTFAPTATFGRGSGTFYSTAEASSRASGGFGSPQAATLRPRTADTRGIATPQRGAGGPQPDFKRSSPLLGVPHWSNKGGGGAPSPSFIKKSSSESMLRRTTGSMWGTAPANRNIKWTATPINAPSSEHTLMQQSIKSRKGPKSNMCSDFIPIEH